MLYTLADTTLLMHDTSSIHNMITWIWHNKKWYKRWFIKLLPIFGMHTWIDNFAFSMLSTFTIFIPTFSNRFDDKQKRGGLDAKNVLHLFDRTRLCVHQLILLLLRNRERREIKVLRNLQPVRAIEQLNVLFLLFQINAIFCRDVQRLLHASRGVYFVLSLIPYDSARCPPASSE